MARTTAAVSAMVLLLTFGEAKSSETESADKSQYTLFNPTPDRLMRDLTTDRPDVTENPFTVDAGHVQVETNVLGYSKSRPDLEGTITDTFEVVTSNIRVGLTNSAEINFILQPYGVIGKRPLDPSTAFRSSGVGGLEIRAKFNLWGNDTFGEPGSTALALLPFVTLPIDRTNGVSPTYVEGGLVVPFGVQLSDKFGLGINAVVLYLRDSGAARHHAEFLTSASLAYEWTETFSTYYEVVAQVGRQDPQGDIVLLDSGFTYKLNKNVQLDGGVNFGVTPAAARINPLSRHSGALLSISLIVTSTQPHEGKTMVASCLTITASLAGYSVLLVDADLRRPWLAPAAGIADAAGLGEVLEGVVEAAEAIHLVDLFADSQEAGPIRVMAAGRRPPAFLPAVDWPKARTMFQVISRPFGIVLFDSPPILAASDALPLAGVADGVLLVVGAGSAHRDEVRRAKEQLHQIGTPLIGAVLNQFDPKIHGRPVQANYGHYRGFRR